MMRCIGNRLTRNRNWWRTRIYVTRRIQQEAMLGKIGTAQVSLKIQNPLTFFCIFLLETQMTFSLHLIFLRCVFVWHERTKKHIVQKSEERRTSCEIQKSHIYASSILSTTGIHTTRIILYCECNGATNIGTSRCRTRTYSYRVFRHVWCYDGSTNCHHFGWLLWFNGVFSNL